MQIYNKKNWNNQWQYGGSNLYKISSPMAYQNKKAAHHDFVHVLNSPRASLIRWHMLEHINITYFSRSFETILIHSEDFKRCWMIFKDM